MLTKAGLAAYPVIAVGLGDHNALVQPHDQWNAEEGWASNKPTSKDPGFVNRYSAPLALA
jgi:hypothetical protein